LIGARRGDLESAAPDSDVRPLMRGVRGWTEAVLRSRGWRADNGAMARFSDSGMAHRLLAISSLIAIVLARRIAGPLTPMQFLMMLAVLEFVVQPLSTLPGPGIRTTGSALRSEHTHANGENHVSADVRRVVGRRVSS
jgi:hypothetical protein